MKSGSQINLSSPLRLSTAFCANPLRRIYIIQLSKNEKTEIIVRYIQFLLHIFNVYRSLTDIPLVSTWEMYFLQSFHIHIALYRFLYNLLNRLWNTSCLKDEITKLFNVNIIIKNCCLFYTYFENGKVISN